MIMRSNAPLNAVTVHATSSNCINPSAATHTSRSNNHTDASTTLAAARKRNLRIVTRVPKFLRCLYDILHHEDASILGWAADGAFFQIFDTKRLEETVLPKYFKHSKFASFQRQLNNFGFRKWTKTQSSVCTFSHHLFVQRHPNDLVELVIEQNEVNSREQQDSDDDRDSCDAVTTTTTTTTTVSAPAATASPKRSPVKKRKRAETADSSELPLYKQQHVSAVFAGRELSFQEQLSFQVESWDLMPITNPMAWETHQSVSLEPVPLPLLHVKRELGNETPTSATATLSDLTLNFTMEELDDILFTTSDPECCAPTALPIAAPTTNFHPLYDMRYFASVPTVDSRVMFAAPMPPTDTVDHAETVKYLNEMLAKPENEFWLPC